MTPGNPALAALDARRSVPSRLLGAPGPDDAQLARILASAVRVPDHGKLVPWRFVRITGDTRLALGERLAARARERDADAPEAAVEKDRLRFSFAPTIIAVVSSPTLEHKVPVIEQQLSGGAVCFALLQAAQALGFGAQWLTGWPAYDEQVHAWFGLQPHEAILGFVHIGTASEPAPERVRPDPAALLSELSL
jgi:nitroreductase